MAPRSRARRARGATDADTDDGLASPSGRITDKGTLLLMMPSITDVNGAGGVAARWHEYTRELTNEGWTVELWTVDAEDPDRAIPRYHLPNFPSTLTDSPGVGFCHKIWRRLNRRDPVVACVVMTDLFSNVPIAMMCAGTGTPLVYSIHTDIAQLDGINMAPWSAAILQSTTSALAHATVTTSPSFKRLMESRGIRRIKDHYRPLPVSGVVAAADALSDAEVAAVRNELTAGHPTRPVMTYVGRWSAEKRMHLLKQCRPRGVTLAFVGDGPMRDVVMDWHDPPRCVVLPGMRPRTALAGVYRATDWVCSASAFETFGNVPYEAAHCGTPALLQDAQGFKDQIDANESRGALLEFDAEDGEQLCAAAMGRTSRLLNAPHVVRSEARRMANRGTCIHAVVSEVVTKWSAGPVRKRRWIYLACAIWSSLVLASILQVMSFFMRLGVAIGVDFTTGMKNQRMSKQRWALRKTPTSTVELARMRSLVHADALGTTKGISMGDDEEESGRRSPDENVAPNGFAGGDEQRSRANRKFRRGSPPKVTFAPNTPEPTPMWRRSSLDGPSHRASVRPVFPVRVFLAGF